MIGQVISHYRITAKLGEGGMGAVYRAQDQKLQREVALKFLPAELAANPQARKRLVQEARAASRLNHPNIATIYEVSEAGGTPFIAMELVQGESLKQQLQGGALPAQQLVTIARQIAEGIHEAHQAGILHRDIKPANIMVDGKGRAKILDFGLAVLTGRERSLGETEEHFISRSATEWSTGGTVPYMSPEQLRGETVDARSDIFSFGVLLYECLAGRLPFGGETAIDILHAILRQPPTPLRSRVPDISSQWEQLIEGCLAKAPEKRFASMTEVLESLGRITAPTPATEKSVAVLYFENLSGAKEDEYFRDGMTEDVITELLKVKGLQVFPRATVLAFRDKPMTARQVGQQLSAAYVLSGSLRRAGNRLRITAQLIDTRTDFPVWAERYDRELQDVFEVQDEIARSIAQALRVQLSPQEQKIIARKPTENLQAYDFYLRGRNYARRENLDFALQMFEHAIKLDPEFALAHAGLGSVCGKIYDIREKHPRWIEKGLTACDHALAVDPQLPEGLEARARIAYAQKDFNAAVQYAQKAIERKPDCEGAYDVLGRAYFASDRFEEAAALIDRALEASGDDYNVYIPLLTSVQRLGQTTQAQRLNERLAQVLKQQLELVPEDVRARILLANRHAELGDRDDAIRELQTAVALRPGDCNVLYNAACTYGIMQEKREALDMFQKAVEAGYNSMDWASRDPDLSCLHGDPEFERLIKGGEHRE